MTKRLGLVTAAAAIAIGGAAHADTLDVATFTPPAGWTADLYDDHTTYSTTGAEITIEASVASTGAVADDFAAAWQRLVATPDGIKAPAEQADGTTDQGLPVTFGVAATTGRKPATVVVAVIAGGGRAVAIYARLGDDKHIADADTFVAGTSLAGVSATSASTSTSTSTSTTADADVSDYHLDTPAGWTRSDEASAIRLTSGDGACLIAALPEQPSAATIEDDVSAAFAAAFPGALANNETTGGPWEKINKGISAAGWEYMRVQSYIQLPTAQGTIDAHAFAFVARLDGKTAVIVGSHAGLDSYHSSVAVLTNTPTCLDDYKAGDWPTVFYSLEFASWTPKPSGLATQLIGRWSWASSTMALMYTFAANGHYDDGAGTTWRSRIDATTVRETHYAWLGSGTYKLRGDQLTLSPKKHKRQVNRIRIEQVWEYGSWTETLLMTQPGQGDAKLTRDPW